MKSIKIPKKARKAISLHYSVDIKLAAIVETKQLACQKLYRCKFKVIYNFPTSTHVFSD